MDFAPTPFPWIPGAVFVLLPFAVIALFTVPALSRWRRLGWALLIALAVLLVAALIWTWLA